MTIQPSIRLASLLAFALVLPWQPLAGLCLAALCLLVLLVATRPAGIVSIIRGIRRIRFLLLALAILYFGFTPGEPFIAALGNYSPSREGVMLFAERGSVLVLMLVGALLVLHRTPTAELVVGMRALLSPLIRARLVAERFPRRLALVFTELDAVEAGVRTARDTHARTEGGIADAAANLWLQMEIRALHATAAREAEADSAMSLQTTPAWQWLLPVLIGGIGILLIRYGGN